MFICKTDRNRFIAEGRGAYRVDAICVSLVSLASALRKLLQQRSPIFAEGFRQ